MNAGKKIITFKCKCGNRVKLTVKEPTVVSGTWIASVADLIGWRYEAPSLVCKACLAKEERG